MSLHSFSAQSAACPPCCAQANNNARSCQWVDDMLAICGGLLFVGVSRHELATMAPCRRQRRQIPALEVLEPVPPEFLTEGAEPESMEYPPLRLVRG